jgi:hypothetical protein
MSQSNAPHGRGPGNLTGILMMGMGFLVLAITVGLIPTDPANIQAPGWLLAVFGGMFVLAGVWVILLRAIRQDAPGVSWLNLLFSLLIMIAIAGICLWIGFGPGERLFVNTDSLTGMRTSLLTDPTLGRIFFGFFGLLMTAATAAIAVMQGGKLLRG